MWMRLLLKLLSNHIVLCAFASGWLVNAASADVTVVPPKVVDTITIGSGYGTYSVAVDHKADRVYVANAENSTITVVDRKTDKMITTIAIDDSHNIPGPFVSGPAQVLVDEDNSLLYVLTINGTISVVDANTYQVKSSFVFDSDAGGFEGLVTPYWAWSKKTGKLYVQNDNFRIDILDLKQQKVIDYINDDQAGPLTINQRTNKIYISNAWNGTVWVINGDTDQVEDVISGVGIPESPPGCHVTGNCVVGGSGLNGVAVDEQLERLYVAGEDGRVVTIDTKTNKILSIKHNIPAFQITVNPVNHAVYVIDDISATLSLIDGVSDKLVARNISVGVGLGSSTEFISPQNITVDPKSGRIYVADFGLGGPDQVVVLNSYLVPGK